MTAPDQCCINVKKLLSIRRRPHMDPRLGSVITTAWRASLRGLSLAKAVIASAATYLACRSTLIVALFVHLILNLAGAELSTEPMMAFIASASTS